VITVYQPKSSQLFKIQSRQLESSTNSPEAFLVTLNGPMITFDSSHIDTKLSNYNRSFEMLYYNGVKPKNTDTSSIVLTYYYTKLEGSVKNLSSKKIDITQNSELTPLEIDLDNRLKFDGSLMELSVLGAPSLKMTYRMSKDYANPEYKIGIVPLFLETESYS
jgi:hypothetical protein